MKKNLLNKTICTLLSLLFIFSSVVLVGAVDSNETDSNQQTISMTEYDPATGKSEIKEYKIDSSIIKALQESEKIQANQIMLNPRANVLGNIGEFTEIGLTSVANTKINPYSAIGFYRITTTAGITYGYGTAFMISDNVAVTAAHCLYNRGSKKWFTGGYFYPGRYGKALSKQPFGATYAKKWAVCTQYIENTNDNINKYYDWGAIVLDENIGKKCGKLSISPLSYEEIRASKILTAGYPQQDDLKKKLDVSVNYSQYQQIAEPKMIMDNFFTTPLLSKQGQSGSPAIVGNTVCGVLSEGFDDDIHETSFTRINETVYSFLMQFVNDNA